MPSLPQTEFLLTLLDQCQYQSCDKFLHVKFLQFFILCFTL